MPHHITLINVELVNRHSLRHSPQALSKVNGQNGDEIPSHLADLIKVKVLFKNCKHYLTWKLTRNITLNIAHNLDDIIMD